MCQTRLNSLLLLLATAAAPASNPVLVTLVRATVMTSSGEVASHPFAGVERVSFLRSPLPPLGPVQYVTRRKILLHVSTLLSEICLV